MTEISKTDKVQADLVNRMTLIGLFRTSCEIADLGLINAADKLTEQVGATAERAGYYIEELFEPLWERVLQTEPVTNADGQQEATTPMQ